MCHFKIKSSKLFLGGRGHSPSPDSTPSGPSAFVLCLVDLFIYMYIYSALFHMQQNFKISRPTSEYLRCASKCAISRLNSLKFSFPDPCPGIGTAEQSKYVRIPEIWIKMRHFKIENQKNFLGRGHALDTA